MKTQNANNSLIKQLLASQIGLHYMELLRPTNTGSSLSRERMSLGLCNIIALTN